MSDKSPYTSIVHTVPWSYWEVNIEQILDQVHMALYIAHFPYTAHSM